MKKIDYSIIVPVFCNELSLIKFYKKLIEEILKLNNNLIGEIIFVDDGSFDNSFKKLEEIKKLHKIEKIRFKIIKLTRNFGQIFAIQAGYSIAKGNCIINLAADLQDPPYIIKEMVELFLKNSVEIIIATRSSRNDSFFRKINSKIFYWLIKKISFSNMPLGGFDIVLISSKVKKYILNLNESDPFFQGQILWLGNKIKFISYNRCKRQGGGSKWTFTKKIKYLVDGVMGYSFFPIRLITVLGIVISLIGFSYALYILIMYFLGSKMVYGWAPIMITILILGGFQMLMLGIMGEYNWRILSQVRNRPKYIIDKILK